MFSKTLKTFKVTPPAQKDFSKIKIIPETVTPPSKASIGESNKDILNSQCYQFFCEKIEVQGKNYSTKLPQF